MTTLLRDLRFGCRTLAKQPAFALVAALTLAIGIGANTALFSIVDALLLRPPVAGEPSRMVTVNATASDRSGFHAFSYLDARDLGAGATPADPPIALAAWTVRPASLGLGDEPWVGLVQAVSTTFFDVMGVAPAAGRFFAPDEEAGFGAHPVAVVGDGLAARMGGPARAVGQNVRVNGRSMTVVGVAPEGFRGAFGPVATEVWLPLSMYAVVEPTVDATQRGHVWLEMVGRLAPGVSRAVAEEQLDARMRDLDARQDGGSSGPGIALRTFGTMPVQMRGGLATFLAILMGVVGLLLLITCVNVAGLLLTRAATRRQEIAVRLALGAGRLQVVRQLVTETLLLFFLGGALGALGAHAVVRLVSRIELPLPLPLAIELGVDLRVLTFTFVVALAAGLLFGLAPALATSRVAVTAALDSALGGDGARRVRWRSALVVAQVAVALVLVAAAGLFLRALMAAASVDPGFRPDGVHLATIDLTSYGDDPDAHRAFYLELERGLRAIPGAESVALGRVVPLGLANSTTGFNVPGHDPPPDDSAHPADINIIGSDYFRTLGMPLVAGRGFRDQDHAQAPRVAVVNRHLAERFWPGDAAVGRVLQLEGRDGPDTTVIGVVADAKVRSLGEAPRFMIYRPFTQSPSAEMTVHLRAPEGAVGVPAAIREAVRRIDPDVPSSGQTTLRQAMGLSLLPQRVAATATGLFGGLGLLLVSVGLYGVTALAVSQRTREWGLRVALGARVGDVARLVLARGLRLGLVGIGLGLAATVAGSRVLGSILFGVSPTDPWVLGSTALLLLIIVVAGCLGPALRAARVDPLRALRHG